MTPMVDLGFLLITFFIFTTSLTQPTVTKLTMPQKSIETVDVFKETLLTAVLNRNSVSVYEGGLEQAIAASTIKQTDYNIQTGLGSLVREKQKALDKEGLKDDLMVVIKPTPSASYQDVMNALDEMLINGVTHYSVVDASPVEKDYLASKHQ